MKKILSLITLIILVLFLIILIPNVNALTGSLGNARMIIRADVGDIVNKYILVRNVNEVPVIIELAVSGDLKDKLILSDEGFILQPGEEKKGFILQLKLKKKK